MKDLLTRVLFVFVLLFAGRAGAQQSLVKYLPLPEGDHEWDTIALSLEGDRLYMGDYANSIAVLDTTDDALVDTFELPSSDDEWIGGITASPEGRLFVSTDIAFYELDPEDGTVLQEAPVPYYSWSPGPFVFNAEGDRAYLASDYEVFALQVDPLQIVDTIEGDEIDGILAVNPEWGVDGLDAYRIALSPDGDRLILGCDQNIKVISGLSSTTDFTGLTLDVSETVRGTPRIALSADGRMLFDRDGNVWDPEDLSLLETIELPREDFEATDLVLAPDGNGLFFQGFSSSPTETTYYGEHLIVVDTAAMAPVDLDGVEANGVTGIDLPEATGWNGTSSYNNLDMVVHPSGEKLYLAAGSSGGLVVNLNSQPIQELTGFFPRQGGNEGDVTLSLAQAYPEDTVVSLVRSGEDSIDAYETAVYPTRYDATFDLRGVEQGEYKVVVTQADGPAAELPGVFTVEETREDATLDLVGGTLLTHDTEATTRVIVQNTGNVDLRDLIVTLRIADGTRYRLRLPAMVPDGETQRDEEFTKAEGLEPIWISRLKAGHTYEFELVVAVPEGVPPGDWDISVRATVGYLTVDEAEPENGSSETQAVGSKSGLRPSCRVASTTGVVQSPLIGELCSIGDALVTATSNELKRRDTGTAKGDVTDAMRRVVRDSAVEYGVAKVKDLAVKGLTILVVAAAVPAALPVAAVVVGVVNDLKSCADLFEKLFPFGGLFSMDPNDKISTTGLDGYIEGNEAVRYVIYFENLPEATAAATLVTITDELDEAFDLSSFELVGTSHPDELEVTIDPDTRVMTASFTEMNLPPNQEPPEGQGFIEFTVRLDGAPEHGTVIRNQAEIVFDVNEPILTPEVKLEVDTRAPRSEMEALPETTSDLEIPLSWSGDDRDGVGVWDYTVMVSEDEGSFVPWLSNTTDTEATYPGSAGHAYRFLVMARDRFGNQEDKDDMDTSIRVAEGGDGDGGCGCRSAGAGRNSGLGGVIFMAALVRLARRRTRRV